MIQAASPSGRSGQPDSGVAVACATYQTWRSLQGFSGGAALPAGSTSECRQPAVIGPTDTPVGVPRGPNMGRRDLKHRQMTSRGRSTDCLNHTRSRSCISRRSTRGDIRQRDCPRTVKRKRPRGQPLPCDLPAISSGHPDSSPRPSPSGRVGRILRTCTGFPPEPVPLNYGTTIIFIVTR